MTGNGGEGIGGARHRAALRADLLRAVAAARDPLGFGWLRADLSRDPDAAVHLWITCRMTHVASLAAVLGEPPAPRGPGVDELHELARHGVSSLLGPLRDERHGGWFAAVDANGPVDATKQAYGHSFVVLAAASAVGAGVPGAESLLDEALLVSDERLWDEEESLVVDEWDRAWTTLSPYRGLNANMHTVEAYLAAGDVTDDDSWWERADRIASRVVSWARDNQWRVPEHFDGDWTPSLDHNRDRPDDQFRPFGATVGHGLEWARLLVAVDVARGRTDRPEHRDAAVALFDRAVEDGWAVDGTEGFVYTTDWDGTPVVRQRMHWVLTEAIAAATILHRVTGDARHREHATEWWSYADRYLVDHEHGSWHHELDPDNRPAGTVWPGKPDVYHAYQSCLVGSLPVAPSFVGAVTSQPPSAWT